MAFLRQFTILQRLILMLVLAACGTLIFASFSILEQRSNLLTQQQYQLKGQLQTASSLITALASRPATETPLQLISELSYAKNGRFVVLSAAGERLAGLAPLMDKVDRAQWQTLTRATQNGGYATLSIDYRQADGSKDTLTLAAMQTHHPDWIVATAQPESDIDATMMALAIDYLLIMLAISLPIFAFFIVLNQSICSPLGQAIQALNNIARGDGDLTQRLDTRGKDEVARLSEAFNEFVAKLSHTINQLQPLGSDLAAESSRLQRASHDANASAEHVHEETSAVAVAVRQMLSTTREMAVSTQQAADAAGSVRQQAAAGLKQVDNTTRMIAGLAGELGQSRSVTESLQHASNRIGGILDVIRGISEQTNLLALNAAIEAARAGTQGRGFAVVADEVRALANRTQASTEQIQLIIKEIQQGVGAVLGSNQTTLEQSDELQRQALEVAGAMQTILELINQISDMNTHLASATEEQSLVTEEISRNVGNITELTEVALQANQSNANAAEVLQSMSEQLTSGLSQFRA
ncbi:methyl-accepting chemotaxis protein [Shewanella sp. GXUN23E]|uniref:methyl-accepting chemotaxis protein n=1 Tax=Shewanella sp. GXUN23E TaxID=3422498 RepID=UPI003D7CCC2D